MHPISHRALGPNVHRSVQNAPFPAVQRVHLTASQGQSPIALCVPIDEAKCLSTQFVSLIDVPDNTLTLWFKIAVNKAHEM